MSRPATVADASDESTPVLRVGVIGVGQMGQHHARIYRQLSNAQLVGVSDLDMDRAREVAVSNDTDRLDQSDLLERVDAVSVAVPTSSHLGVVQECIDAGVDVLVEKPLAETIEDGHRIVESAAREGTVLQVGHIERFNPAVQALFELKDGLDLISGSARRLGPPVDRPIEDGVIRDLMIHDLDVLMALTESRPSSIDAVAGCDEQYASALLTFPDGFVASLTASRVTHRRVREIDLTADTCQVDVNYLDQSVHIHRRSDPEYIRTNGNLCYRNESVVERPVVERGEPLKRELASFVQAVQSGATPVVSGEDGVAALEVAEEIRQEAISSADGGFD